MKRILVVEDEKDYREILTKKLSDAGFEVISCENGKSALDFLMKEDVNLIVLDQIMPEIDGVTFMDYLKNSLMKKTPVIILTNLNQSAYQENVVDFLLKANTPIEEVVRRVKTYAH